MNDLRDDLRDLAREAPSVDLATRAMSLARRRRAVRLAVTVAAAVAVVTGSTAVLTRLPEQHAVVVTPPSPSATSVLPLPEQGVGALQQAYQEDGEWRLVTWQGEVYDASELVKGEVVPAITQDGRRIAYFDGELRTIVLRDLESGQVWEAPLTLPAGVFDTEYAIRLSPSGKRMIVAGWGTSQPRHVLVDLDAGTVKDLNKAWFPVSVSDSGEAVLIRPFDDVTRLRLLGRDPITLPDFTHYFSALGPDGRTIARLGQTHDPDREPQIQEDGTIVLTDVISGVDQAKVPLSGIPDTLHVVRLGGWRNKEEITLFAAPESAWKGPAGVVYAVNVHTGQARAVFEAAPAQRNLIPGLVW
ncbi:hypothetical protein ACFXJ8_32805 [Nonomuraea sp. NPDC059194]|uniref:hypothetical protein n=1 Tax=Nonomuraea sp. NPDC059194 TaxID=3346764 RepID=UPI0036D0608B